MKIFKFLLKLILVVVILVGVAVGVVVYRLSDKSFNEPDYLKNVEPIEFDGNALLSKGIKDSATNNSISLTFEEKEMSILLKCMSIEMNKSLEKNGINIETMYLDIENSHDIKFISYFDLRGFKTSLKGDFELDIKDEIFTMTISNFKVGKMKFDRDTLNKYVDKGSVKKNLQLSGINLEVDLSSFAISFDIKDIKELVSGDEEKGELYTTLIDIFFRVENLIRLSEKEENIGIDIDLTSFGYDEQSDAELPYELDFASINAKLETLLNNESVRVEDATLAATYLTKGYLHSSEEIQNYVKNIDFSSVGIDNVESYEGIIPINEGTVEEYFVSQIPSLDNPLNLDLSSFEGLKLTEEGWNNYFATSESVGQVHSFVRKENGIYKSSYIGIESLFVDIKNNHFALYLITSINGKRIVVDFELDSEPTSGLRISSDVSAMRIGDDVLIDEEIKKLLNFLNRNINDEWIIVDSENKKMDFDFALLFDGNQELNDFMEYFSNATTSFVEKDGNGYTLINMDLNFGI